MEHRNALSVPVAALATCAFGVLFVAAYWLFLLDDDQGRVRKMVRLTVTALLCFALGCASQPVTVGAALGAQLIEQEIAIYPPIVDMVPSPLHHVIFQMMERCSGRSVPFESVRWKTGAFIMTVNTRERVDGVYFPQDDGGSLVVIARQLWNHPLTLSHEILHVLYRGTVRGDVMESCTIRNSGVSN